MLQTINLHAFRDAFRAMDRKDQFSYDGLAALFDYLEDVDPDFDLDVVALCCDYREDSVQDIAENYGLELPQEETEEDHYAAVRAYLEDHTFVVAALPRPLPIRTILGG